MLNHHNENLQNTGLNCASHHLVACLKWECGEEIYPQTDGTADLIRTGSEITTLSGNYVCSNLFTTTALLAMHHQQSLMASKTPFQIWMIMKPTWEERLVARETRQEKKGSVITGEAEFYTMSKKKLKIPICAINIENNWNKEMCLLWRESLKKASRRTWDRGILRKDGG